MGFLAKLASLIVPSVLSWIYDKVAFWVKEEAVKSEVKKEENNENKTGRP